MMYLTMILLVFVVLLCLGDSLHFPSYFAGTFIMFGFDIIKTLFGA